MLLVFSEALFCRCWQACVMEWRLFQWFTFNSIRIRSIYWFLTLPFPSRLPCQFLVVPSEAFHWTSTLSKTSEMSSSFWSLYSESAFAFQFSTGVYFFSSSYLSSCTYVIRLQFKDASPRGLSYVFATYCGIFVTSTVLLFIYVVIKKRKPFINSNSILPAFATGSMWAVAQISWYLFLFFIFVCLKKLEVSVKVRRRSFWILRARQKCWEVFNSSYWMN